MSCEPSKFRFDPNDVFYLCPPMCNLLHYRHGAVLAGLAEVALSVLAVFAFMSECGPLVLQKSTNLVVQFNFLYNVSNSTVTFFTCSRMYDFLYLIRIKYFLYLFILGMINILYV